MTQDERAYFLTLKQSSKLLLTAIVIVSWTCSTFMKYIVYKHFAQMKTDERPITLLIIMGQIVDYVIQTFISINYFMILASGSGPVDFLKSFFNLNINSYTYCWTYCYISLFWIGYTSYSGLGMAVARFA